MKTTIFLSPNLKGHLNPTVKIAKKHQKDGYKVFYGGMPDLLPFTITNGFKYYGLGSLPFATGFDDLLHEGQKSKWLESLIDRFTDRHYNLRKKDLEKMVYELNPEIIFLDEFNYSDFILLYPFLENRKVNILQTKFPMYYNEQVPPLNTFAFPGEGAKSLWRKYFRERNWKLLWKKAIFFGKSDRQLLHQKFLEQGVPDKYKINIRKVFQPSFENVEEWFLVPQKLDFNENGLLPNQKYKGVQVDLNRKEELSSIYSSFLEQKEKVGESKLLYCSLGTVLKTHLKHRKKAGDTFFKNLIELAFENPKLFFLIAIEEEFKQKFKSRSTNLLFVNYAPQLDVLKRADIFLTHAGMGSVIESVLLGTPMLLFPINDKWDQNGTAARVVHYGLGLKSDLNESKKQLTEAIFKILEDKTFNDKIERLGKSFNS